MQTHVHVFCTPGTSVREMIAKDAWLPRYAFEVVHERKPGRSPGWMKLRSRDPRRRGSINIEWNASTRMLSCRVVNKGAGKPDRIIGDFVGYLLRRQRRRIMLISVVPG